MTLKALLFDLDGTLADTDPVHMAVFVDLLTPHGYKVDETFFRTRISGARNRPLFKDLFPGISDEEADRQGEIKEVMFRERVIGVKPIDGLFDLLDWGKAQGFKIGLVTNAPQENADALVPALGLSGRFDLIISAKHAPIGKPDPAPYLLALEKLGLEKSEAVVFEDSSTGIRSSAGAGIFTFGLTTSHDADTLKKAGAGAIIADFKDSALWQELNRLI